MTKDPDTENRILEAAESVFHERGYDGARMREIAERANTNKGLLHYYFKTKDTLFQAIFGIAVRKMVSRMQTVLELDMPLEEKIDLMVDQYMSLVLKNPALPCFVISELNKNPEQFISRNVDENIKQIFAGFQETVKKEAEAGRIRHVDGRQLMMNLISMILFPFIARPMIQVIFGTNNEEFKELLSERKDHIKAFIKAALKP